MEKFSFLPGQVKGEFTCPKDICFKKLMSSPACSPLQLKPWPGYITERLSFYEELKRESDALLAQKAADSKPITVELPDGRKVEGKAWLTTPYQLACDIRLVLKQLVSSTSIQPTTV